MRISDWSSDVCSSDLTGRLKPLQELQAQQSPIPSRFKVFKVSPRVLIENKASRSHTVIEVTGSDSPGLLYLVTTPLTRLNLMIKSAPLENYGERAVAASIVPDPTGMTVESKPKACDIATTHYESLGR